MGNSRTRSFWFVVLCAVFALAGALSLVSGFGAKAEEPVKVKLAGLPTLTYRENSGPDADYQINIPFDKTGWSGAGTLYNGSTMPEGIKIGGVAANTISGKVQAIPEYNEYGALSLFLAPEIFGPGAATSIEILAGTEFGGIVVEEGISLTYLPGAETFVGGTWVNGSEPALTPITVIEMQKPSYRSDADDYTFAFGFSGQFDTAPNTYLSAERFPEGIELNEIPFKTLLGKNLQGNYNSTAGVTFSSSYMIFYVPKDAFDPAEENSLKIAAGTSFFGTIIEQEVFVDYDPLTEEWYAHGEIPPPPPSVTADSLPGAVTYREFEKPEENDYTFELAFTGNEFTIPTASGGYLMAWQLPSSMSVNGKGINTLIGTDRDPVNGTYPTTAILKVEANKLIFYLPRDEFSPENAVNELKIAAHTRIAGVEIEAESVFFYSFDYENWFTAQTLSAEMEALDGTDLAAYEKCKALFDGLSETQKALLSPEAVQNLSALALELSAQIKIAEIEEALSTYLEAEYSAEKWAELNKYAQDAISALENLKTLEEIEAFDVSAVLAQMAGVPTLAGNVTSLIDAIGQIDFDADKEGFIAAVEAAVQAFASLPGTVQGGIRNVRELYAAQAKVFCSMDIFSKTVETLTLEDKEALTAANTAYGELLAGTKLETSVESSKEKLDALANQMLVLETGSAVAAFQTKHGDVLALTAETVKIQDETLVQAALADFADLNAAAQAELTEEKSLLDALAGKIAGMKEAEAFRTEYAEALALTEDTVTSEDNVKVGLALDVLKKLSETAQAELAEEKAHLEALSAKIAGLKAAESFRTAHGDVLALTTATVKSSDKAAVQAALTAYEALTADAKTELSEEKSLLDALAQKIEELLAAEVTYTVTFETNGGSAVSTQTVLTGQKATEPEIPTREGYQFAGWYSDSGLTTSYDFDHSVTGNVTLYAKWTAEPKGCNKSSAGASALLVSVLAVAFVSKKFW